MSKKVDMTMYWLYLVTNWCTRLTINHDSRSIPYKAYLFKCVSVRVVPFVQILYVSACWVNRTVCFMPFVRITTVTICWTFLNHNRVSFKNLIKMKFMIVYFVYSKPIDFHYFYYFKNRGPVKYYFIHRSMALYINT